MPRADLFEALRGTPTRCARCSASACVATCAASCSRAVCCARTRRCVGCASSMNGPRASQGRGYVAGCGRAEGRAGRGRGRRRDHVDGQGGRAPAAEPSPHGWAAPPAGAFSIGDALLAPSAEAAPAKSRPSKRRSSPSGRARGGSHQVGSLAPGFPGAPWPRAARAALLARRAAAAPHQVVGATCVSIASTAEPMSRLRTITRVGRRPAPRRLGRVDEQLPGARVDNQVLAPTKTAAGTPAGSAGAGASSARKKAAGGRAYARRGVRAARRRAVRRGAGRADRQRRRDPRDRAHAAHRGRRLDLPVAARTSARATRPRSWWSAAAATRAASAATEAPIEWPSSTMRVPGGASADATCAHALGRVLDEALATVDEAGGLLAHRAAAGVALEAQAVAVLLERVERAAERDEARREPPRGERLRRFVHAVEEDDRRRDRAVRTVGARPRLDVQLPAATAVEERRRAGRFDGGGGRLFGHRSSQIVRQFHRIQQGASAAGRGLARVAELRHASLADDSKPIRDVAQHFACSGNGPQQAPGQVRRAAVRPGVWLNVRAVGLSGVEWIECPFLEWVTNQHQSFARLPIRAAPRVTARGKGVLCDGHT